MQAAETAMAKAAFVALAGRPSAGKSTLVNRLCGALVAVTSPVPQTTRNAIRGVVNDPRGQLVLVDTPGIHLSAKKLNKRLYDAALRQIAGADLVLYVLDATRPPGGEEEAAAAILAPRSAVLVTAVNKMDSPAAGYKRARAFLEAKFPAIGADRVFPISALNNEGTKALLDALFTLAPEGEAFYPADCYTDQDIDFRVAEIIRGEAINRLRQELPHAIYVEVADTELRNTEGQGRRRLWVRAFIVCERESQKGMIVGKGGVLIKAIGEAARKKLNRIFDWKVELDLRVKSGKDWRQNDIVLRKLLDR
jgi:GTP-binding protein Era